jgi:gliding motility-associated-like protein
MKKLFLLLFFNFTAFFALATHNRAGEITYRWIGGLTYEVTITTYTRSCALCADRCELVINWGDGSSQTLPRSNGPQVRCGNARDGVIIDPANQIRKNVYTGTHTYPAAGAYTISMEDRNRNAGINNIINSDQITFYIETELFISQSIGPNSSPILTNPPVERGCINKRFEHNAGAYDPDGDSLAYRLTVSRAENGEPIRTIYDPLYVQDSIRIDSRTGDIIWDAPRNAGQFNFAFEVVEYRKNSQGRYVRIGYVTRDMQVDIEDCGNNPPVINPVGPFCVEAGQRLQFDVRATDPDDDNLELTAFGGPFEVRDSAVFPVRNGSSPLRGTFTWDTKCLHVRKQPYQVTFKAEDRPPGPFDIPLSDLYSTEITVIAPSPKNPQAQTAGRALALSWDPSQCSGATGYLIYRRESLYGFFPDSCETGVPDYTEYEFLDSADQGINDTTYLDTNDLQIGVQYCYMVVAYFPDEAESYASVEFCAALPLDLPLITKVDVLDTDPQDGRIEIAWIAPPELDSSIFPPPYQYRLMRSDSIRGSNFQELARFNGLTDTSFIDENLDTRNLGYNYRVDLYSGLNQDLVGPSSTASSILLETIGVDEGVFLNMRNNTPWINERFVVFREEPTGSGNFDSIAEVFSPEFTDTGRINGENYCYRVRSFGRYTASDSLPQPLVNNSQVSCATARDTIAPCTPELMVSNVCPDTVFFSWRLNQGVNGCGSDVKMVNIYFRTGNDPFGSSPLLSFPTTGDSTVKFVSDATVFGCYAISAVDDANTDPNSMANESPLSEEVCVESCFTIEFPNVFTPNADGISESFLPIQIDQVQRLEIKIYNRWGTEVYSNSDIDDFISNGWDGTVQQTGQPAPDGVYYYVCGYIPQSLGEVREQVVSGFVHLFR